jgi:hypothetical protein
VESRQLKKGLRRVHGVEEEWVLTGLIRGEFLK